MRRAISKSILASSCSNILKASFLYSTNGSFCAYPLSPIPSRRSVNESMWLIQRESITLSVTHCSTSFMISSPIRSFRSLYTLSTWLSRSLAISSSDNLSTSLASFLLDASSIGRIVLNSLTISLGDLSCPFSSSETA